MARDGLGGEGLQGETSSSVFFFFMLILKKLNLIIIRNLISIKKMSDLSAKLVEDYLVTKSDHDLRRKK